MCQPNELKQEIKKKNWGGQAKIWGGHGPHRHPLRLESPLHLSAQSYRTWLHIIYDSDSFGDYCNVPSPFYNCSVVPKLMSWEVLRYD